MKDDDGTIWVEWTIVPVYLAHHGGAAATKMFVGGDGFFAAIGCLERDQLFTLWSQS